MPVFHVITRGEPVSDLDCKYGIQIICVSLHILAEFLRGIQLRPSVARCTPQCLTDQRAI